MRQRMIYIMLALLLMSLVSCEHKLLCFHDENDAHSANVWLDVDWTQFTKEEPTGMTLIAYPTDPIGEPITHLTNNINHAAMNLPAGVYTFLVYNQSEWEFASLNFRGMNRFQTAEVYLNTGESNWYRKPAATEAERIGMEPEWFATDNVEGIELTHEITDDTEYIFTQASPNEPPQGAVVVPLEPANVIYTLTVRVHLHNVYNLRSARASMSGLAEGYRFATNSPSAKKVTQLIENWQVHIDKDDATKGYIEGKVRTFGLPHGHSAASYENEFTISLLLVDNKTVVKVPFEVGDKIVKSTWDSEDLTLNLELEYGEPLPDVQPEGGEPGGFEAEVDDWGPEEDYEVEI